MASEPHPHATSVDTAIPSIDTVDDPILGPDDLRQRWRALMGPLGFSESLIWLALIDPEHRISPPLTQLPLPVRPDEFVVNLLMSRFRELLDGLPGFSVACLVSRPGSDGVSDDDTAWARMLTDFARRHQVALRQVHRANDRDVVTLTINRHSTTAR